MGLRYLFFQVVWPVFGPMESTGVLCKGGCSWCILCFSGWSLLGLGAGSSSSRVRDKLGWCWLGEWSWSQEQNPGRGIAMPIGGSLSILDFFNWLTLQQVLCWQTMSAVNSWMWQPSYIHRMSFCILQLFHNPGLELFSPHMIFIY